MLRILSLTVAQNNIHGTLPPEWEAWGASYLNVRQNALQGSLPPEWSRMGFLDTLILAQNQLTSMLPSAWGMDGGLARLTLLNVSDNSLTGGTCSPPLPLSFLPACTSLRTSWLSCRGSNWASACSSMYYKLACTYFICMHQPLMKAIHCFNLLSTNLIWALVLLLD